MLSGVTHTRLWDSDVCLFTSLWSLHVAFHHPECGKRCLVDFSKRNDLPKWNDLLWRKVLISMTHLQGGQKTERQEGV